MVVIGEVGVGLAAACCGGLRSGLRFRLRLLGGGFCGGFVVGFGCGLCCGFFFLGGWGLRLWLVVVFVAVTVIRSDELEKLKPWRF